MVGRQARVAAWRCFLSLLGALLLLGHACELPAFAELISHHTSEGDEPAPAEHHGDGDDHALACEAVVVVPSCATPELSFVAVSAIAVPVLSTVVPRVPRLPAPAPASTGPPLFLLLSSLLI